VNSNGKKCWRAGPGCKASQHYPPGFGLAVRKLMDMHADDLKKYTEQIRAESADTSIRGVVFAQSSDDWDDASLDEVFNLLS